MLTSAKVIYDAHEDLPATIYAKTYIPLKLRGIISKISNAIEKMIAARMHAVIAATPFISVQNLMIIMTEWSMFAITPYSSQFLLLKQSA